MGPDNSVCAGPMIRLASMIFILVFSSFRVFVPARNEAGRTKAVFGLKSSVRYFAALLQSRWPPHGY